MSAALGHLADDGTPCTLHGPASPAAIATLAAIGARVSGFNHDIASKLQGLMMALDELDELTATHVDPAVRRALDSAQVTLRELGGLLTANRALTRANARTTIAVRDLVRGAGERVGVVVQGTLPDRTLEGVPPLLQIAVGLALDAVAGTARARSVAVHTDGDVLVVPIAEPAPATASDLLAIAAHVIAAAGGALCCGRDRTLRLTLPRA